MVTISVVLDSLSYNFIVLLVKKVHYRMSNLSRTVMSKNNLPATRAVIEVELKSNTLPHIGLCKIVFDLQTTTLHGIS